MSRRGSGVSRPSPATWRWPTCKGWKRRLAALPARSRSSRDVQARVYSILDQVRHLERELALIKSKQVAAQGDSLLSDAVDVKGAKCWRQRSTTPISSSAARDDGQAARQLKSAVVVLASVQPVAR